ncbi:RHS repeat-associated protein [Hamadaea flava]|uniref:RHS repeat-associated core domain-containing protein n=1 Tax=Hamadaea flava TaxID=1742688 RepID=A0ABV8LMS4_9ACTN|nr:RHS repeat-associated core domain-containing protein [Hamadaea flava]MCP2323306.1 RHS repeat-associated protein [Hamadaea flava]
MGACEHEVDESYPDVALTTVGAREYDPTVGRFISADPVANYLNPQQLNGYAYASNSPLAKSDPSELYETQCSAGVAGCSGSGMDTSVGCQAGGYACTNSTCESSEKYRGCNGYSRALSDSYDVAMCATGEALMCGISGTMANSMQVINGCYGYKGVPNNDCLKAVVSVATSTLNSFTANMAAGRVSRSPLAENPTIWGNDRSSRGRTF